MIAERGHRRVYRSAFSIQDISVFSDLVCRQFIVEYRIIWNEAVIVEARHALLQNGEIRYIIYAYAYIIYL